MIDRLRQMAIFAKAIDHGSFRGAASELKISPSVVSHHISQLEAHLGVTLIYRSTRKLTLTRDGKRLLKAARKMLNAVEEEILEISGSAREPAGELRITLPTVLSQSRLTKSFADFMALYPKIKLSVDFSDVRRELIGDGFDVAFRMLLKEKQSADTMRLFRVDRCLMASREYLADKPEPQTPQDLLDWDWILLSPVHNRGISLDKVDQKSVKIKPEARCSANDARSVFQMIKNGMGVAALPEFLAEHELNTGQIKVILPNWRLDPVHVFAEWPSNAPKHGLIHLLVDRLSTYDFAA